MAKETDTTAPTSTIKKEIIIIKKYKKNKGGAHHGGNWKIAYADFVTAMMAFFLLMWLINTVSSDKLRGISEFFTQAYGFKDQTGNGLDGGSDPNSKKGLGNPESAKSESDSKDASKGGALVDSSDPHVISVMNSLEHSLEGNSELNKFLENIMVIPTPEGITIQIMDNVSRSVFKPGSSQIEPYMFKFLEVVAGLIKTLPNYISIEGHTTSKADRSSLKVDQWSLSIERADALRQFFSNKIKREQVVRIIGKADKEPFNPKNLSDPKNDRIVILLLTKEAVSKFQKSTPDNLN